MRIEVWTMLNGVEQMTNPNKTTSKKIEALAEKIKKDWYPNGVPEGLTLKARIFRDFETGKVVVLNVTEKPDLWHLPEVDLESFRKYEVKERIHRLMYGQN